MCIDEEEDGGDDVAAEVDDQDDDGRYPTTQAIDLIGAAVPS